MILRTWASKTRPKPKKPEPQFHFHDGRGHANLQWRTRDFHLGGAVYGLNKIIKLIF